MTRAPRTISEVAMWHRRSGLPDNVTDEGEIVAIDASQRLQTEKAALRAEIEGLCAAGVPSRVKGLARLAASYLLAGDVETAGRYVAQGRDLLSARAIE